RVEIIVTRAGISDHFPPDHVAITTVNRIGEEPHLHVLDGLFEEGFSIDAVELEITALKALQHRIHVAVGELGEGLAGIFCFAGTIERGQRLAVFLRWSRLGLRALIRCTGVKRRLNVKSVLSAVGPGELSVYKDGAASVVATRYLRIRRDDAIGNSLHRSALGTTKKQPGARLCRRRRISRVRRPRQMIENHGGTAGRHPEQEARRARQQSGPAAVYLGNAFIFHAILHTRAVLWPNGPMVA